MSSLANFTEFLFGVMPTREEILASLVIGRTFKDHHEVELLEKNLREICFMPIIRQDSRTVAAHNSKVSVASNMSIHLRCFNTIHVLCYS